VVLEGRRQSVIFLIDAKTDDEAHAVIDTMPLSKENLMEHEYIPVGPLMPLTALIGCGPARQTLGLLGAGYFILTAYVPVLFITHGLAFRILLPTKLVAPSRRKLSTA
jgi:hypothetical protein